MITEYFGHHVERWANKSLEGPRVCSFSFQKLHQVIFLINSPAGTAAGATGCNKKLQSLDHSWHIVGHHCCRAVCALSEWSEPGGQGDDVVPWHGLLWPQKDGEGVKWDDTWTNIMAATWWWKGHNDGSRHLILHFTAVKPCAAESCVWKCFPRLKLTEWTGEIVFCYWCELISQIIWYSF